MLATRIDPTKLRAAIERKGLTVEALAKRAGINPSTIRYYLSGKRGKRPSYAILVALAEALDLADVQDLLVSFSPGEDTNVDNMEDNHVVAPH